MEEEDEEEQEEEEKESKDSEEIGSQDKPDIITDFKHEIK